MNSYDPCKQHINGHTPQCLICEIEVLRGEVRRLRDAVIFTAGLREPDEFVNKLIGQHALTKEREDEFWHVLGLGNNKEG